MEHKKVVMMTEVALMAAVICVLAPFSLNIPVSEVAVTLGLFGVYLAGAILGARRGTLSVLVYILIGAAGVPVFSNFSAGFGKIAGPSGGYLLGYLPCAFVIGFLIEKVKKNWIVPVALVAGTAACYLPGTIWMAFQLHLSAPAALAAGVLPYLPLDVVKIIAAGAISVPVRNVLLKNGLLTHESRSYGAVKKHHRTHE